MGTGKYCRSYFRESRERGFSSYRAKEFASGRNVKLIEGDELRRMIREATDARGAPVTAVRSVPIVQGASGCPQCGGPMVKRVAKRGANAGQAFYGCSRYPVCRGTRTALLHHSDQGSQYASEQFQRLLADHGVYTFPPDRNALDAVGPCAQDEMGAYYPVALWCEKATFLAGGFEACSRDGD